MLIVLVSHWYRDIYSEDIDIGIVERNQVCKNGIYFSSSFVFALLEGKSGYIDVCVERGKSLEINIGYN